MLIQLGKRRLRGRYTYCYIPFSPKQPIYFVAGGETLAERRMFAKSVIDSDFFLEMPLSTQALYFHLALRADDDGFVGNPKKIVRMVGADEDSLKILIAKSYIIPFENGIVVIRHWKIHNSIRKDRYKPTLYQTEMNQLLSKRNSAYLLLDTVDMPNDNQMDTIGLQNGNQMDTQDRIGKVSIDKVSIDKENITTTLNLILAEYTENVELIGALKDFVKSRELMKAPLTDRAMRICLSRLDELGSTDEARIAVVEQSIEKGWKTFYPIKDKETNNPDTSKYDFVINNF